MVGELLICKEATCGDQRFLFNGSYSTVPNNLDKGLETDIIYLDFSKAFDSVCHQKRLSKLLCFAIDGPHLNSLRATYLQGSNMW